MIDTQIQQKKLQDPFGNSQMEFRLNPNKCVFMQIFAKIVNIPEIDNTIQDMYNLVLFTLYITAIVR